MWCGAEIIVYFFIRRVTGLKTDCLKVCMFFCPKSVHHHQELTACVQLCIYYNTFSSLYFCFVEHWQRFQFNSVSVKLAWNSFLFLSCILPIYPSSSVCALSAVGHKYNSTILQKSFRQAHTHAHTKTSSKTLSLAIKSFGKHFNTQVWRTKICYFYVINHRFIIVHEIVSLPKKLMRLYFYKKHTF